MSALRSSAGPAVCTSGAPSSAAMMWASEVLPRPGGPASRTWSSDSRGAVAASMKTSSCEVTWRWLTKSASRRGRSERSSSSSAPASAHLGHRLRRSGRRPSPARSSGRARSLIAGLRRRPARRAAQRGADQVLGRLALGAVEQLLGLGQRVAEVHEAVARERARVVVVAAPRAPARPPRARRRSSRAARR